MALELLGFENDITRSRIDLEDNFKILDSDKAIDEIFEKILQFSKSKKSDSLNTNIGGFLQMKEFFIWYYKNQVATLKVALEERPFHLEPIFIGIIELLFYFSNLKRKNKPESEDELIEELFPRIEKYFAIMEIEKMKKYDSFEKPEEYFEQNGLRTTERTLSKGFELRFLVCNDFTANCNSAHLGFFGFS